MIIVVNSPRIRALVREARNWRSQGYSKANIQTFLQGSTDLAGVSITQKVILPVAKSAERTLVLAEVPA